MKHPIKNIINNKPDLKKWLPTTKKEANLRGWDELDVVLFTGDAYVDHPSFGVAVIGRLIEKLGFKVAIVAQPNWKDDLRDFKKFGIPKLFFAVTSGNMDSMINHYTANKRTRAQDAYTPGGNKSYRPDYATVVYSNILKDLFPEVPIVIGGIEASLRRLTHYDYWSDKLRPSFLFESKADLLIYGMGEKPLKELLFLLKKGIPFSNLTSIKQTAFIVQENESIPKNKNWEQFELNSHETCLQDKIAFAKNFKIIEQESNKVSGRRLIQKIGNKTIVINPTFKQMVSKEIDQSFDLPFTRLPHPKYAKRGAIPAFEMIKFSINMHRGCFGGCSFCTISAHQGKFIASRSKASIMKEIEEVTQMPDFKGYLSDLGGPSANMYGMQGYDLSICDKCVAPSCISPVVCSNLDTSHYPMMEIYEEVRNHPKIKKAFIGSGIRYDLLVRDFNKKADGSIEKYIDIVVKNHISGRLKVAPEHTSDNTLEVMRKPSFKHFHTFKKMYEDSNKKHNLNQPLIPYFISSHPGCKEQDMAHLAAETKDMGFKLEQVQDFTPTPMTVATIIYYTGVHPYTLKPVFTAKTKKEKLGQHQFFFWHKKEKHREIKAALIRIKKPELVDVLLRMPKGKNKDFIQKKKNKRCTKNKYKKQRFKR